MPRRKVPLLTGVYFLLNNRKVIYIGQTKRWPLRVCEHKEILFDQARLFKCPEDKLFEYESRLISVFKPKNNRSQHSVSYKREMRMKWIIKNKSLIYKSIESNDFKRCVELMRRDLKYSPKYPDKDIVLFLKSRIKIMQEKNGL